MSETDLDQTQDKSTLLSKEIVDSLVLLNNFSAVSLLQEQRLGSEFNFAKGKRTFERILRLFNSLGSTELSLVPPHELRKISDHIREVIEQFKRIKGFSPSSPHPLQERDRILSELENQYHTYFANVAPVVSYGLATQEGSVRAQAESALAEIRSIGDTAKKEFERAAAEAEQALAVVRQTASAAGVSHHANNFGLQAEEHKTAAYKWLWASGAFAFVTLLFVIFGVWRQPADGFFTVVPRLLIFSLLYSCTVWCSRQYRSNRHNEVINSHRKNALATFEAFAKAASDEQTKNAVLLQTTQAIFALNSSGFLSREPETNTHQQTLVELVRSSANKPS